MREIILLGGFGYSNNKLFDLKKFCKLIDSRYRGPYNRLVHLLSKYKQFGGDLRNIIINNKDYKINVYELYDDNNIDISLASINGSVQCGSILIDKTNPKKAIIIDMHAYDSCYETTIEDKKASIIIMKILIELCKEKGIKKIYLSDKSHIPCGSDSLDLKIVYTMTHGIPWYYQFGFIPKHTIDRDIIKYNYNIMKNKKVKNVDRNVFVYDKYIKLYVRHLDMLLISFIEMIGKLDCKKFKIYYKLIYNNLGLKELIHDKMILIL